MKFPVTNTKWIKHTGRDTIPPDGHFVVAHGVSGCKYIDKAESLWWDTDLDCEGLDVIDRYCILTMGNFDNPIDIKEYNEPRPSGLIYRNRRKIKINSSKL